MLRCAMASITKYPLRDPETGELIDNFKTMPQELIDKLREHGHSDEEIRFMKIEVHRAAKEVKALLDLLSNPVATDPKKVN